MSINLSALMKQRYDTAANWTAQNPTLLAGEIGIESDTKKWKVGTGATAWTSLVYAIGGTYPIVNADIAAAAAIVDTKLATIATAGKVSNSATTAASANTASAIVARDASGNFTAGTITAALTGAASANVLKAGDTMTGVLAVTAGTAALPGIAVSGDPNTGITSPGADQLAISTGGTVKATIDSSGRLLVGTSSALNVEPFVAAQVQAEARYGYASIYRANDAGGPALYFIKSRAASAATVVQSGDVLGEIRFQGADGGDYETPGGTIKCEVDGTPGADDMPCRLVFSTTADGAASPTEALRITNDRVLAYNQPTPATYAAAATLTVADLKTGIITYAGANATLTLPTGTLTEGGFDGIYTNMAFEWSVINTGGAGNCTIGAGTAHTIVGSAIVSIGTSGRFASRRTAANTFVSYRLS